MRRFKFSKLRDIAQGDFTIRDEHLFYKEKEIAAQGNVLLDSSEEVFFLFTITDEAVSQEFKYVIFLNYFRCDFYPCNKYQRSGDKLNFTAPNEQNFSFKRYCYNGNIYSSKIIGGHSRV